MNGKALKHLKRQCLLDNLFFFSFFFIKMAMADSSVRILVCKQRSKTAVIFFPWKAKVTVLQCLKRSTIQVGSDDLLSH